MSQDGWRQYELLINGTWVDVTSYVAQRRS